MHTMSKIELFQLLLLVILTNISESVRGGRRGGKGKGKSNLQFAQIAEFSFVQGPPSDNRSAHIVTGSHFSQTFRLGFKLVLICIAQGQPRPTIKHIYTIRWYKEGAELQPKANAHHYEKHLGKRHLRSKLEIDPTTMGDQGVYACVASNERGLMAKNFKAEYTY